MAHVWGPEKDIPDYEDMSVVEKSFAVEPAPGMETSLAGEQVVMVGNFYGCEALTEDMSLLSMENDALNGQSNEVDRATVAAASPVR